MDATELFLALLDGLLIVLAAARAVRLVVFDVLGGWWFRDPIRDWANRHDRTPLAYETMQRSGIGSVDPALGWRSKVAFGIDCPFCAGFWVCGLVVATYIGSRAVGGDLVWVWRGLAGWFALSWLIGHLAVRSGDTGWDTDTPEDDDTPAPHDTDNEEHS